jgi:hypothetical protein
MGFDVYVGTLTRYYLDSPTVVVERIARQQHIPYTVVHGTHGDLLGGGRTAEDVLHGAALAWRDELQHGLGERLAEPLEWDESPLAPWWTGRPGWDGYGGMVLLAAHDEHPELSVPSQILADWPDDPAYQASLRAGARSRYDQLLIPELWLPCRFEFTFRTPDLTGQELEVGSSVALLAQLRALEPRVHDHHHARHPLAPAAGRGLATLLDMTRRSVEQRLPMRLDY